MQQYTCKSVPSTNQIWGPLFASPLLGLDARIAHLGMVLALHARGDAAGSPPKLRVVDGTTALGALDKINNMGGCIRYAGALAVSRITQQVRGNQIVGVNLTK